jgi:hypothetical protein
MIVETWLHAMLAQQQSTTMQTSPALLGPQVVALFAYAKLYSSM